MKGDVQLFESGRDDRWRQMLDRDGSIGLHCVHLGGDSTTSWIVEVDRASRQGESAQLTSLRLHAGDRFVLLPSLVKPVVTLGQIRLQSLVTTDPPTPRAPSVAGMPHDICFLPMDWLWSIEPRNNATAS